MTESSSMSTDLEMFLVCLWVAVLAFLCLGGLFVYFLWRLSWHLQELAVSAAAVEASATTCLKEIEATLAAGLQATKPAEIGQNRSNDHAT